MSVFFPASAENFKEAVSACETTALRRVNVLYVVAGPYSLVAEIGVTYLLGGCRGRAGEQQRGRGGRHKRLGLSAVPRIWTLSA